MFPEFDVAPHCRLAYLVMRKCGCSSIRHSLSKIRDQIPLSNSQSIIHDKHAEHVLRPLDLVSPESWFKFSFVRDPIRRFISFYSNKILDQNVNGNHTFLRHDRFGLLPNMTIDQVLDVLVSGEREIEPHLVPQSQFIDSVGFELDFVGRLESLKSDLGILREKTGILLEPDHLNRSSQLQLLPNREQFQALAEFYSEDIARFGYCQTYNDWLQANFVGRESKYQLEPGFTFENEAKLLKHSISKTDQGFTIKMKWRVDKRHHRKRVVRVVNKEQSDFNLIWHLPPKLKLTLPDSSVDRIVEDSVTIPFEKLPPDTDLTHVYHQLYFSDQDAVRALLTDYSGHDNMLLFPFGHLNRVSKSA